MKQMCFLRRKLKREKEGRKATTPFIMTCFSQNLPLCKPAESCDPKKTLMPLLIRWCFKKEGEKKRSGAKGWQDTGQKL